MTIAACYHSNEGIVLGADSTATVTPQEPQGYDVAIRHFNHWRRKSLRSGCNSQVGSIGISVDGLAEIGPHSNRSLAARFADDLEAKPPSSMDEVAERWSVKIWDVFSSTYTAQISRFAQLATQPTRTDEENKELTRLSRDPELGPRLVKA